MKPEKIINILWAIFITIGTIFIVIGIVLFVTLSDSDNKAETMAVITDIVYRGSEGENRNYDVIVEYEIDGKEYTSHLNVYSSSFYEGKEIEISYDINNPHRVYAKFSYGMFMLVFSGIGSVFFIIGAIGLISDKVKSNRVKELRNNGEVIYADYIKTSVNQHIRVNYKCPFVIVCEWKNPTDGERYLFRSENIWEDPEYIIKEKDIRKFPVYVKPDCYKKYVMDIDEIKNEI